MITKRQLERRKRPAVLVLVCGIYVIGVMIAVIFGPLVAPQDPAAQDLLAVGQAPNAEHLFGTDVLGRDVLSRALVGTTSAILGPIIIALGANFFATLFGLVAGYHGGVIDGILMRTVDLIYAIPSMLVALVVVGIYGGGYFLALAILIVLGIPAGARMVRSVVIAQRPLPYVESALTLGMSHTRIMFVHVLPNVRPTIIANVLLDFVYALVALSSLSFLGVGLPPGSPDWGRTLSDNRELLGMNPAASLLPAVLIILTASAVTVLADWAYNQLESKGTSDVH